MTGSSIIPARDLNQHDPLDDFSCEDITLLELTKKVYVSGRGPAVIVMCELPGISPHVARFARWVRDAGFTVFMPSLFGIDGAVADAEIGKTVYQKVCVSAEFRAFASNQSSPVTQWLRALAGLAHQRCGGVGVGAIGMCFTGNFALTMMLDASVVAPVLCQPSLPFNDPAGLEISPEELRTIRQRLDRDNLTVMAYRFAGDPICTGQRFRAYADALGDRFIPHVLPDSAANKEPPSFFTQYVPNPHSVVTAHLIDKAGQPTLAARDEILAFLAKRLS